MEILNAELVKYVTNSQKPAQKNVIKQQTVTPNKLVIRAQDFVFRVGINLITSILS